MRRACTWAAAVLLAGCVPDYDPFADAQTDGTLDAVECDPLPDPYEQLNPWVRETETGYDHRAGVGDDRGVIHHEAFLVRRASNNTMLSFQDYLGPDRDRSPSTSYELADQFSPSHDYLECELCVLFLQECPYESLGGCQRQFLAVAGTITFDAFEKADGDWSEDTLDALAVRMEGLRFREVVIDTDTFQSPAACPTHICTAQEDEDCFEIQAYQFDYIAPD